MLTAAQVKKLPVGTRIVLVENDTGKRGTLTIVKSGRKKMLRNLDVLIDIKDTDGWHYESAGTVVVN